MGDEIREFDFIDTDFDIDLDIDIDFDLGVDFGTETTGKTKKQPTTSDKYAEQSKQFLDNLKIQVSKRRTSNYTIWQTIQNITLPLPKEIYRIRTQTQTSLLALVLKIAAAEQIEELTIATYTINEESFNMLTQLLCNKRIGRINLLIASSYVFRDKKYFELLKSRCLELSANNEIHLTFAWTHIKVTLAKCGDNYYHIEGSMNYSQNNMAENLVFSNDKESYDFDYGFITGTMQERKNKALEIIC